MPTAAEPSLTPGTPALSAQAEMIAHGIWVISPAPSPESSSAEHPPRCSMQPSAVSAWETTLWERSARVLATNPTPHASFSSSSWLLSTAPPTYAGYAAARACCCRRDAGRDSGVGSSLRANGVRIGREWRASRPAGVARRGGGDAGAGPAGGARRWGQKDQRGGGSAAEGPSRRQKRRGHAPRLRGGVLRGQERRCLRGACRVRGVGSATSHAQPQHAPPPGHGAAVTQGARVTPPACADWAGTKLRACSMQDRGDAPARRGSGSGASSPRERRGRRRGGASAQRCARHAAPIQGAALRPPPCRGSSKARKGWQLCAIQRGPAAVICRR